LAGTGVRAVSFFGVLMNRALTTSWFWCCTLRNGSCLGGTVLLRGVVSAFFLALEGSTLVRGGDACRVQIRWILGLGLSPAAFSAASVPALSRANRAFGGFGGAECGYFSVELYEIKKTDFLI
jgi:hypothetical protein